MFLFWGNFQDDSRNQISTHYVFLLTSVQVILVPYCSLFGVLSNYMLKVPIGTFS